MTDNSGRMFCGGTVIFVTTATGHKVMLSFLIFINKKMYLLYTIIKFKSTTNNRNTSFFFNFFHSCFVCIVLPLKHRMSVVQSELRYSGTETNTKLTKTNQKLRK